MDIKIITNNKLKQKPNDDDLTFGTVFTDNMFVMDYQDGIGWYNARIEPFAPITMSPASSVLHYGQAIFEGLKAYRNNDNDIVTFRSRDNFERMNRSAERMCMAQFDVDFVESALSKLLKIEQDWVPCKAGTTLYIRPFMIATDPYLGVKASPVYTFYIILSPVGAYYVEGVKPINIYVCHEYIRAARGGVGNAKAAGNYAASLYATQKANENGFTQVLWLDSKNRKFVEEVGTSNIFFLVDNVLVTPSLDGGSILPGITRNSVLNIAKDMGITIEERDISIDEIIEMNEDGRLTDVFGSGTAAVISPVGYLTYKDKTIKINNGQTGDFTQKMYDMLTGIQLGLNEDKFNWVKSAF